MAKNLYNHCSGFIHYQRINNVFSQKIKKKVMKITELSG